MAFYNVIPQVGPVARANLSHCPDRLWAGVPQWLAVDPSWLTCHRHRDDCSWDAQLQQQGSSQPPGPRVDRAGFPLNC